METNNPNLNIKVFIPERYFNQPTGFMYGYFHSVTHSYYVIKVQPYIDHKHSNPHQHYSGESNDHISSFSCLGFWKNCTLCSPSSFIPRDCHFSKPAINGKRLDNHSNRDFLQIVKNVDKITVNYSSNTGNISTTKTYIKNYNY